MDVARERAKLGAESLLRFLVPFEPLQRLAKIQLEVFNGVSVLADDRCCFFESGERLLIVAFRMEDPAVDEAAHR